jgi:hypothetical protein
MLPVVINGVGWKQKWIVFVEGIKPSESYLIPP